MMSGMHPVTARLTGPGGAGPVVRWPAVLAGLAGCLFLVVATSPQGYGGGQLPPFLATPLVSHDGGPSDVRGWLLLVAPVAATALGLCLLRWWPYLLASAALMAVPGV